MMIGNALVELEMTRSSSLPVVGVHRCLTGDEVCMAAVPGVWEDAGRNE